MGTIIEATKNHERARKEKETPFGGFGYARPSVDFPKREAFFFGRRCAKTSNCRTFARLNGREICAPLVMHRDLHFFFVFVILVRKVDASDE